MTINNIITFEKTYKNEGPYENNLEDGAGETNGGITKMTYPHLDIAALTKEQIFEIYNQDFWVKYNIGSFISQGIADQVFDAILNTGPFSAIMVLQLAIQACGSNINLDGKLGPMTFVAANNLDQVVLLKQLRLERIRFYLGKVDASPTKVKFMRSWIRRSLS